MKNKVYAVRWNSNAEEFWSISKKLQNGKFGYLLQSEWVSGKYRRHISKRATPAFAARISLRDNPAGFKQALKAIRKAHPRAEACVIMCMDDEAKQAREVWKNKK